SPGLHTDPAQPDVTTGAAEPPAAGLPKSHAGSDPDAHAHPVGTDQLADRPGAECRHAPAADARTRGVERERGDVHADRPADARRVTHHAQRRPAAHWDRGADSEHRRFGGGWSAGAGRPAHHHRRA
ncbi:hypothetical protein M9458_038984, partial [Cirrhinus mrigala]